MRAKKKAKRYTAVFEKTCATTQKNVKSHVFLKSEKNVKNVKKRRPTAYVQFHRLSITQPLILNYRNRNSVPVPFLTFFIVIWTFSTSVVYRGTCRVIITKTARSTACSSTGWPRWDRYRMSVSRLVDCAGCSPMIALHLKQTRDVHFKPALVVCTAVGPTDTQTALQRWQQSSAAHSDVA